MSLLLLILSLVVLTPAWKSGRTIDLVNNCPHDIWIGASGNPLPAADTGFLISQGGSRVLNLPPTWVSGRIWARTGCSWQSNPSWGPGQRFVCATGDCGSAANNFGIQCNGIGGQAPASLAEFTLSDPNVNNDFYDLSNVDGWNVDLSIESISGTTIQNFGDNSKFNCGNPKCNFNPSRCPTELTLHTGSTTSCFNLCLGTHSASQRSQSPFLQSIFNNQELLSLVCCDCWYGSDPSGCASQRCSANGADCCGCFNPQSKHCCSPYDLTLPNPHGGVCRVEDWPKVQSGYYTGQQYNTVFKDQCPDAYSWQFDDLQSTYQCKDSNYRVTFCAPGGGSPPPPPQSPPPPPPQSNPPPPTGGAACADPSQCRSQWGYCGVGNDYCGAGCQAGPCTGGNPPPPPPPPQSPNPGSGICSKMCAINGNTALMCQPPGCPVCFSDNGHGGANCQVKGSSGTCGSGQVDCSGTGGGSPPPPPPPSIDCGGRCALSGNQNAICQPPGCPPCKIVENGHLNCYAYIPGTNQCPSAAQTDCSGRGARVEDDSSSSNNGWKIGLGVGLGVGAILIVGIIVVVLSRRKTGGETV